ncbi:hypothetical protein DAETH_21320 [Deinococcus aetherius]|uniref:Uncharacterized protein n=1 Tax=Deinococcus aetherius TaxID=200252 RepID=A0ABN6RFP6_9DEIO|nr:hypothetical protein [Deinococcus aetherius]BDP42163.1 hypothetical protein DAETH_21320 [Deinococcus aetherius]
MASPRLHPLWPLAVLLALGGSHAQTPPNCALARVVDAASYDRLTITLWSEADQDNSSANWAECRAAALSASLAKFPQVRARIATLRGQLREMRALEGQLAGIRAGGGTMYAHAIPRSYAPLEDGLASLAALARTTLGGRTSEGYARVVRESGANFAAYVKTLRAYRPGQGDTSTLYDPKEWAGLVNHYETLGKAVMLTLGTRGDAATALGYGLLVDQVFPASDRW